MWNFGFCIFFFIFVQVFSGVFLSFYYVPSLSGAFDSVIFIIKEVNYGWFFHHLHGVGASFFFFFIYLHVMRSFVFSLCSNFLVWFSGGFLFIISVVVVFLGYSLPMGSMSYWAIVVVVNFFSVFPFYDIIRSFILGGSVICDLTLRRFFIFHFILSFILFFFSIFHVFVLHFSGSRSGFFDGFRNVSFYPFMFYKDLVFVVFVLFFFSYFVFFDPYFFYNSVNFIEFDPFKTPEAIEPEWYLMPFFIILKSFDSKAVGLFFLFLSFFFFVFLFLSFKLFYIHYFYSFKVFFSFLFLFVFFVFCFFYVSVSNSAILVYFYKFFLFFYLFGGFVFFVYFSSFYFSFENVIMSFFIFEVGSFTDSPFYRNFFEPFYYHRFLSLLGSESANDLRKIIRLLPEIFYRSKLFFIVYFSVMLFMYLFFISLAFLFFFFRVLPFFLFSFIIDLFWFFIDFFSFIFSRFVFFFIFSSYSLFFFKLFFNSRFFYFIGVFVFFITCFYFEGSLSFEYLSGCLFQTLVFNVGLLHFIHVSFFVMISYFFFFYFYFIKFIDFDVVSFSFLEVFFSFFFLISLFVFSCDFDIIVDNLFFYF